MDLPLILFLTVVLPIALVLATDLIKRLIAFQEKRMDLLGSQTAERAAQYAAKTERLEQRVAVLERLLTDRSTQLADEIEQLRPQPLN